MQQQYDNGASDDRPIERAAGGLVVRDTAHGHEVLLIEDTYGHLTFPKGHLEAGETWESAAVREVKEETGIDAEVIGPLGRVEYVVTKGEQAIRKQVRCFLLKAQDSKATPVHQAEEIKSARFFAWDDAAASSAERGYSNWSFVFDKAQVLYEWYASGAEQSWRLLPNDTEQSEFKQAWGKFNPLVLQLIKVVRAELKVIAPRILEELPDFAGLPDFPRTVSDEQRALHGSIEHTLLKPEASLVDVEKVCIEARDNKFRAACVNPQYAKQAAALLAGSGVTPCVVIGFPFGATTREALRAEAHSVCVGGAEEVDMVIPVGAMREDDIWTVFDHVRAVCDEVHQFAGRRVKVILEVHFLSYAQVAMASFVAIAAGADFIKTSTGFAPSGAKLADIALMASIAGKSVGVKAAGGIRTRNVALQFLRYGATRIGASSGLAIVRQ